MERIGSDESLKGDTFGGIVVAAVKANDKQRKELEEMGVKDGKTFTKQRIKVLAQQIPEVVPVFFVNMLPLEYNQEIQKYGLTSVLNKLHERCIKKLARGDEEVIVDAFPGASVTGATLKEKAESEHVEVAAASIIARAEGIKQMQALSIRAGFELPFGSTHVLDALVKMRDGKQDFTQFAKTSFRNVKEVMHTQQQEGI